MPRDRCIRHNGIPFTLPSLRPMRTPRIENHPLSCIHNNPLHNLTVVFVVADAFSRKIHCAGDLVWGRVREAQAFQRGSVRLEDRGRGGKNATKNFRREIGKWLTP